MRSTILSLPLLQDFPGLTLPLYIALDCTRCRGYFCEHFLPMAAILDGHAYLRTLSWNATFYSSVLSLSYLLLNKDTSIANT